MPQQTQSPPVELSALSVPDEVKKPTKEFTFKIGADPEFNILFQNDRLNANFVIKSLFKKDDGLEEKDMGFLVPKAGELGWDGCASTAELRPMPSNQPRKIVEHLGKILVQFANKIKLFNLSTLSNKASVGGHIHFELPKDRFNDFAIDSNMTPTATMRRLHRCVSLFYLPLLMGENNENLKIRMCSSYGKLEDFRLQSLKTGGLTYEFRAPSAEWLTTPKVAESTLAYLGVVFHEFLNHPQSANKIKELLLTNNKQLDTIQQVAISNFSVINNFLCTKIKKALRQFELYPVFTEEIEYILNAPRVLKDKEKVGYDILRGWNMKEDKMPTRRQLMSDRKIKELTLNKDMESIIEMINIKFNPDSNCEAFARSLKEKVVALNWQLKNNYYLFGLRSGIADYIAFNAAKELYFGKEQVVTKSDWSELFNLMTRIQQKFGILQPGNKSQSKFERNTVIIGVPYQERVRLNTKGFTQKVIAIEKGLKAQAIKEEYLENDSGKNIEDRGRLFRTLAQDRASERIEMIDQGEDLQAIYQREQERESIGESIDQE